MTGPSTMGRRIASLRGDRKWTQKELAEKASITPAFISDIENDKRTPSMDVLLRISEALGASMDFLATGRTGHESARQPLVIPSELAQAADEEGWSLGHTADLLRARQIVHARRTRSGERHGHFSVADWKDFHRRLFSDG